MTQHNFFFPLSLAVEHPRRVAPMPGVNAPAPAFPTPTAEQAAQLEKLCELDLGDASNLYRVTENGQ